MRTIKLDFETRSEADIKKVGAYLYAKHPSTDVLCLAYKFEGQEEIKSWEPGLPFPQDLMGTDISLKAHNSFFEFCVWNFVLIRYGAEKLPNENFYCTAAKAAYHALPRDLLGAGMALKLTTLKDEQGKKVMMKLSKVSSKEYKNDTAAKQKERARKLAGDNISLQLYNIDDVAAEDAIDRSLRDLSEKEREIFLLDQRINLRGVPVDMEGVNAALWLLEDQKEKALKRIKELTFGEIESLGQREKLLQFLARHGVYSETLQKGDVETLLGRSDLTPRIREILELRASQSKASTAKFEALKNMTDEEDHRMRGLLLYYGATTGRWAGRGFQPHNLPRGNIKDYMGLAYAIKTRDPDFIKACFGDVMNALSCGLRGMIAAPNGKKFYCADFSAIESRMVFWLAGDVEGLAIYNGEGKAYEEMASSIFNKPPSQILDGSMERQLGKQAILGCGYGMGKNKFFQTCLAYGINVPEELAALAVDTYRKRFNGVVKFWYESERCAIEAYKTKKIVKQGSKITWACDDRFLYCRLPSGRVLHYPFPALDQKRTPWGEMKDCLTYMSQNLVTRKWERSHTYGGHLVENITQATARDCMAESMLRLEKAGYPVILTVHDEIISETDENFGSLKEFEALMKARPEWAKDCPIDAKGWAGVRYKK